MRVALVSTEFPPSIDGGAGTYAGHLAAALSVAGIDVTVIGPTEAAEAAPRPFRFVGIAPRSTGLLRFWARLPAAVRRSSNLDRFDLVHSNGIAALPVMVGNRRAAIVTTIHHVTRDLAAAGMKGAVGRLGDLRGETGIVPFAERFVVRRSDSLIAVSNSTAEALTRHYTGASRKTSVVYSGIDLHGADSVTAAGMRGSRARFGRLGESLLLTIGRLEHRKGIDVLIEAFAGLNQQRIPARLVIVGVGRRYEYEELARRSGCLEQIEFVERIDTKELAALLAATDLLVMPSRQEGYGFVAFEAMAAGKPVVVTRTGAAKDGLIDDTAGAVVEVGDIEGLRSAIAGILSDPNRAQSIGKRNRMRVGQMSWHATAQATINVYAIAVGQARSRTSTSSA